MSRLERLRQEARAAAVRFELEREAALQDGAADVLVRAAATLADEHVSASAALRHVAQALRVEALKKRASAGSCPPGSSPP